MRRLWLGAVLAPKIDWVFGASFARVVDGDTVRLTVDMGLHLRRVETFRIARVNAPELSTPEGQVARSFTSQWFVGAWGAREFPLTIQTHKTDNWGRYIVEIWRPDGNNLGDDLLSSGNAVAWP